MARSRRLPALLGTATVGLTLLAGCGDPGTITISSTSASATADRSGSTDAGSTAAGTTGQASLVSLHQAGEATVAVTSARYETTIAGGDGALFLKASGQFAGDRTRQSTEVMGLTGDSGGQLTTEMSTDGSAIYVGGSMFTEMAGLFGGGSDSGPKNQWFRIDVPEGLPGADEMGAGFGTDFFGRETAELLSGAYGEVSTIGTEDVRGTATTHHRVEVDPSKVAGTLGGLGDRLTDTAMPVDVWIGDDGLVHRLRFEIDGSALGGGSDGETDGAESMVATFEMWDVGADIDIEIPTDVTVFDPSEFFGGGG